MSETVSQRLLRLVQIQEMELAHAFVELSRFSDDADLQRAEFAEAIVDAEWADTRCGDDGDCEKECPWCGWQPCDAKHGDECIVHKAKKVLEK